MIYFGTFNPGVEEVIAEILRRRLEDVTIRTLLAGAAVFETEVTYDKLNFFCFNNIFAIIDIFNNNKSLETHIRRAASLSSPVISDNNKKIRSFRIVCSAENKPVPVNEGARVSIEKRIASESGLKINRTNPDTEFWFLSRSEGFTVFMKRLTKHPSFDKTLHPGELSPQIAWLLCYLSEPKPDDAVLDPFCGYGSIPYARIKYFPCRAALAFDVQAKAIAYTKNKIKQNKLCLVMKNDVKDIPLFINAGEVDAIITDPPWGLYQEMDIQSFYNEMMKIFNAVLEDGGRIVLLTAKDTELINAAAHHRELQIKRSIPVLISGKKAVIFVIIKSKNKTGPESRL